MMNTKNYVARVAAQPVESSRRNEALWRQRLLLEERLRLRHGEEEDYHNRRSRWLAMAVTAGLRLTGLYGRGRRNAGSPRLREEEFWFEGLPIGLDGFRILHLSDFHFARRDPAFVGAVRRLLDGAKADICVLTGDYRYGYYGAQNEVHIPLGQVLAGITARYGAYAILGNHDLSDVLPGLQEIGVDVLVNEGRLLGHRGASIWLGGVDDPHKFRCADVEDAFAGAPASAFKVLLAHSPECIAEAAALGARLYLCGHTHGGQVRFPVIGALHTNARCARQYAMGRWRYESMQGYTTLGLGATDLPIRFNCPAEAVAITLRRNMGATG